MKEVIYNSAGLRAEKDAEQGVAVYEYISAADKTFRDLGERISKLRNLMSPLTMAGRSPKMANHFLQRSRDQLR